MIEGSPGCGRLTGVYDKSNEQLTISIGWSDRRETPCDDEEREIARKVCEALTHVHRAEPPSRDSKYLELADAEGSTLILLEPMQAGSDLSELEDTFWHLEKLYGSQADLSGMIVNIRGSDIDFSAPSHSLIIISFPFTYTWAGLKFTKPRLSEWKDSRLSQDQQIAAAFEETLHKIQSYGLSHGSLTFFDKNQQPIMVLSDFRNEGIEYHRWRIAKYRGDGTQLADEDGLVDAKLAEMTLMNGHLRGSPGCGGWEGSYTLSGDHLVVEVSLLLLGICEPEGFAQDRQVENALMGKCVRYLPEDLLNMNQVCDTGEGDLQVVKKNDHVILRDNTGQTRILLVPY